MRWQVLYSFRQRWKDIFVWTPGELENTSNETGLFENGILTDWRKETKESC